MPKLQIGRSEIDYDLRRSATATERCITVTPDQVEVLVLDGDDEADIAGFLDRKRQWLFDTVREMSRATAARHTVPRFMTGSKIPYRGRMMPLTVRNTDSERALVSYRNGFVVDLPVWAGDQPDDLVLSELQHWLKQRARRDVKEIAADVGARFGLVPRSIRVAHIANGWGSCGREGNVLINWQLIFAPRQVLAYVVTHELAHLSVRGHGPSFWSAVARMMPEYDRARRWLDRHEAQISNPFA